jgi:hypothetical protein
MRWELKTLEIDRPGSPTSSFSFELHLSQARPGAGIVVGDGVVLTRIGKVLVNREPELRTSLHAAGIDSQDFLEGLRSRVLIEAQPAPVKTASAA